MRPSLIPSFLLRAVLCGALFTPLGIGAAALGEATVRSSIGQRLDADIEIASLSAAEAESLTVRLAPADAFVSTGIDYTALLRSLRFTIEKKSDRYLVRVNSDLAVTEPFVNLLVELSANGTRTIRQYALLIDPPALDKPAEASAPSITPAQPAATILANADASNTRDRVPAAAASAPDKHVVRKGETLRSIANNIQPQGVQLEQVMVALQTANPSAFIDSNANRMRSGSVLTVPDADAMRSIDPSAARQSLRAQTADFVRYQRQLAERSANTAPSAADTQADSSSSAGNRSSSGGISVQINDAKAAPAAQDKLTLSSPGKGDTASSGSNSKEALDKVAADKALTDANSRIAALEKNIGQMQSLLEMQNKTLAEVQQRAVQPESKTDAANTAAGKDTTDAAPADTAPKTEASQPESEPAVPAPAATKPPVPPTLASPPVAVDLWLDDPAARSITGGVAALLIIGWLWSRSRRRERESAVVESEPTIAQTVIAEAGGRQIDTSHSVFHSNFVPSVSQIDANEVDAVAEADVYIAYGRDEQAEEILRDALRAHPQRHALRVKLLEIYANRKDQQKFGTLAAELRVLTHGQGPEWAQAAQLGQLLDPANHLYGVPSHTTVAEGPVTATSEPASVSPVADFELRLEGLLDEHRKEQTALPARTELSLSNSIDFQWSGLDKTAASTSPSAEGSDSAVAVLNTKLELALACREIGDNEGARELLVEVAKAGDPELSGRAKSLLQQLA